MRAFPIAATYVARGAWPRGRHAIVLGALLVAVACGDGSSARQQALGGRPATRLVGLWNATLWLDRPATLNIDAKSLPRMTQGTMAFLEDHFGKASRDALRDPTHVGVYDIDFNTFGFRVRQADAIPVMIARTVAASPATSAADSGVTRDSVYIVLDPVPERPPVQLWGTFAGDSITGSWTAGQALGGGGRFVLRRHR